MLPATSRRRLSPLLLIALVAALLAAPAHARVAAPRYSPTSETAPASATLPAVQARAASDFLNSIGVNVHMGYPGSPYYTDPPALLQRLRDLGIRHVRDDLAVPAKSTEIANLHLLESAGATFDFIVPRPVQNATTDANRVRTFLATIAREFPTTTDSVEGANEYDKSGATGWAEALKTYQTQLYDGVRSSANPSVAGLPVLAPSMGGANTISQIQGISGVDEGNLHPYPGGEMPESPRLAARIAASRTYVSGDKPIVVSEDGYHNALNVVDSPSVHRPADERAAGIYTPRMLLEGFRQGVARTYLYELADVGVSTSATTRADETDMTMVNQHFGLLHFDLSDKPAGRALADLTSILGDDGTTPAPGSLGYAIPDAPSDLRQVLLQKSDGSYYLALWRAASVWDTAARHDLDVPEVPATLQLDSPMDMTTFEPGRGTAPVGHAVGDTQPLSLGADVQLLRLTPASAPATPTAVVAQAGDEEASVSWTQPIGDSPASGFTVTADPGGAAVNVPAVDGQQSYTATVPGLASGQSYTFSVRANNAAGTSPASDPSDPVVAGPPPGVPTQVAAAPLDGAASVSWSPPAAGAPPTGYVVTADPGGATARVGGTPGSAVPTTAVVPGLVNGTAYTFTVGATSDAGDSPASQPSDPVIPGPPGTATGVSAEPGDGFVDVSWSAPAGAPATSYHVTTQPDGTVQTVGDGSGATPTTARVTGLTNGSPYSFTVTAANAVGAGPTSDASPVVVPGPPGQPSEVTAAPKDASVDLSWTPGSGAPATSYRIVSTPARALFTLTGTNGAPPPTSVTVPNLINGTAYQFTVTGINAVGAGNPSAPSSAVLPIAVPGTPTAVTAKGGDASATVQWVPSGGPASSYTVTASPGGTQTLVTGTNGAAPPTSAVVTGLANGTTYRFSVIASNTSGASPASVASAPVVPGVVTLQETAPGFAFGGWTVSQDTTATGGSYRWSSTAGDRSVFSFAGTSVSWMTRRCPACGKATLQVDAKPAVTVDLYSSSTAAFTKSLTGLTSGAHTLTVRVSGTKNALATGTGVASDGFRVGSMLTADSAPAVVLSDWRSVAKAAASGGALRVSRTPGARLTLPFTGTGADWLSARGPAYGQARVLVDGVYAATVDLYSPTQRWQQTVWSTSGLTPGVHTLVLQPLGSRNPASTSADVPVDAIIARS